MTKWYETRGPYADAVLASFVRLARNIEGLPFPVRLNPAQKRTLAAKVRDAAAAGGKQLRAVEPAALYPYEAVALAERCVITPAFAAAADGATLLPDEENQISLMLCEEDHVRILAARPGLQPEKAYEAAKVYDDLLDRSLRFAFDPTLGYLNQDPLNVGTGMKASVIMHLPALSRTGAVAYLASTAAKLGVTVKGAFGDGLTVRGDLYRVSNNLTMGLSEREAIGNLKSLCLQLATKERDAAEQAVTEIAVRDRINRAYALLSGAALLSADEMAEMLSAVRMGALYGLLEADLNVISTLFVTLQPAGVNCIAGKKLPREQRDELRARLVREKLFG